MRRPRAGHAFCSGIEGCAVVRAAVAIAREVGTGERLHARRYTTPGCVILGFI